MAEHRRYIRAFPVAGGPPVELWEGTPCIFREGERNTLTSSWPGDADSLEVLSYGGDPALPIGIGTAHVRIRSRGGLGLREEARPVLTLAYAIWAPMNERGHREPEEHFVRIGESSTWKAYRLESWRDRAGRFEHALGTGALQGVLLEVNDGDCTMRALTGGGVEVLRAGFVIARGFWNERGIDKLEGVVSGLQAPSGELLRAFTESVCGLTRAPTRAAPEGSSVDPVLLAIEESIAAARRLYSATRLSMVVLAALDKLGITLVPSAPARKGDGDVF